MSKTAIQNESREKARALKAIEINKAKSMRLLEHLKNKPNDVNAQKQILRLQRQALDYQTLLDNGKVPKPKKAKTKSHSKKQIIIDANPVDKQINNCEKKWTLPKPTPIMPEERHPDFEFKKQQVLLKESGMPLKKRLTRTNIRNWCCPAMIEAFVAPNQEEVLSFLIKNYTSQAEFVVKEWMKAEFGKNELASQYAYDLAKSFIGTSDNDKGDFVDEISSRILEYIPEGAILAPTKKDILSKCKTYFEAVKSHVDGKSNGKPNMFYLGGEDEGDILEGLEEAVSGFNYDSLDKAHKLVSKASSQTRETKSPAKSRRISGSVTQRAQASILYDTKEDCLVLAVVYAQKVGKPIELGRYLNIDGTRIEDEIPSPQLMDRNTRKPKSVVVFKLQAKHDFLRWYNKHVQNHDENAPLHRRAELNSFKFHVVFPSNKSLPPKLFIVPTFSFWEEDFDPWEGIANIDKARYHIGIDRGITYPIRAVVYDRQTNQIVEDIAMDGKTQEWRRANNAVAHLQSKIDRLRNTQGKQYQINEVSRKLGTWAKKRKNINQTEVVKFVAGLVQYCEEKFGRGNYCFILENFKFIQTRYSGVNFMKIAMDALTNQMVKRGYSYFKGKDNDIRVCGIWHVLAGGTSQVSPSGWMYSDENDKLVGRGVGRYFEKSLDNSRRGTIKCYAPKKYMLTIDGNNVASFGNELFYDPKVGKIFDADFVGAFNIAVRPTVMKEIGMKTVTKNSYRDLIERHKTFNPDVKISCNTNIRVLSESGSILKVEQSLGAYREPQVMNA